MVSGRFGGRIDCRFDKGLHFADIGLVVGDDDKHARLEERYVPMVLAEPRVGVGMADGIGPEVIRCGRLCLRAVEEEGQYETGQDRPQREHCMTILQRTIKQ